MRFLIQHTEHPASIETIVTNSTNLTKSTNSTIPYGCIIYVGFHRDDIADYQTKIEKFVQKIQTTKLFRLPDSDKIDSSLTDT
jgi:D-Tyr-tRNAtyr deacylase